jgi:hypothetical protein
VGGEDCRSRDLIAALNADDNSYGATELTPQARRR